MNKLLIITILFGFIVLVGCEIPERSTVEECETTCTNARGTIKDYTCVERCVELRNKQKN